jgi:uncharacterized membrane protein (DUF2068 family)
VSLRTWCAASTGGATIARVRRERALSLIIAYKLIKGGLWFAFAAVIVGAMHLGLEGRLIGFAAQLRHHPAAWSLALGDVLVRAATRRRLWTITVALIADGAVSFVEAWALIHGHWWGPWLVVVATASLLPFEVLALARHPHPVRAVVLLLNLAIVVYLARKAVRERRELKA